MRVVIEKAPEVRHVRSPWPAQSGGHGLMGEPEDGSTVGAEYMGQFYN